MTTFTPVTLLAFGVIALIVGGALGYTAGYSRRVEQVRNIPAQTEPLPIFPNPPRSFEDCVASGNPVMESYPRQCRIQNGTLFVEQLPEPGPGPVPPSSTTTIPAPGRAPIRPAPSPSSPSTTPAPAKPTAGACAPAGCSSQLCVDAALAPETVSTCEFRADYACYRTARCERQASGQCGWTQTPELQSCLQNPPALR